MTLTTDEADRAGTGVQPFPNVLHVSLEMEVEHHQKAVIRESKILFMLRIECKFQINMHGQNLFSTLFLHCFFFRPGFISFKALLAD